MTLAATAARGLSFRSARLALLILCSVSAEKSSAFICRHVGRPSFLSSSLSATDDKQPGFDADRIISDLIAGKTPATSFESNAPVRDQVERIFDSAEDDLTRMRLEASDEVEEMRQRLYEEADERNRVEGEKLMGSIDEKIAAFKTGTEDSRKGLRAAYDADKGMAGAGGEARGLTLGSWGRGDAGEAATSAAGGEDGAASPAGAVPRVLLVTAAGPDAAALAAGLTARLAAGADVETCVPAAAKLGGGGADVCLILPGAVSDGASCERLVARVLQRSSSGPSPSHVVLCSAFGTERTDKFPYTLTNVLGAITKMRAAEDALKALCRNNRADYTVLKLGKIVEQAKLEAAAEGAAIGELLQMPDRRVALLPGDAFGGEVSAAAAAAVLYQTVAEQVHARNATLSVCGGATADLLPPQAGFDDAFLRLDGPELCRVKVPVSRTGSASLSSLSAFIEVWAQRFAQPGSGLTTAARVLRTTREPFGVAVEFRPTGGDYESAKEEKERKEREAESGAPKRKGGRKQKREGGVEIVVEEGPVLRVRARRCNMDDDTIVKAMSEELIVRRLQDDLAIWLKTR